ncbi:MAG TPA: alpha-amylase family glycosyl hydrolase [Candidatus Kapabacteria bacterium]|nr:alpha-amylase family glycosyl hydrolase [Candidatus Kapabacteria bacterium]HPO62761.1 alpha-amylase family glycosyl hydrolase [Candidatus Kapabacteria bacterium]
MSLNILLSKLEKVNNSNFENSYLIPEIWLKPYSNSFNKTEVNPINFFLNQLKEIEDISKREKVEFKSGNWSDDAIIYNMFVRYSCGNFLNAIGMLPYIHSLGVNTIYLLPITSIGQFNKKGELGSPYSIRNPYEIDENLANKTLDLTAEELFKAFVEAAHLIGIKVVLEFVFRTASLDSDWAMEHPEWFYWIKEECEETFLPPAFDEIELKEIKEKILEQDFSKLIAPCKEYTNQFAQTPTIVFKDAGKIIGVDEDGNRCVIPSAFADWPPDDKQPLWSDVTYLKLYEHPKFNYIAYNTVRMYDKELAKTKYEQTELWQKIAEIIPFYQNKFGIDGVMIDMGHALPAKLLKTIILKAKEINSDFVFWEENFTLSKKSKESGYSAVVGYLCFDEHIDWKMQSLLYMLEKEQTPIPFFATPENHNTPRAASRFNNVKYSEMCWAINCFLPALPFIHSGFELGEIQPVNTGLDFTEQQMEKYTPFNLPLFSNILLNWNSSFAFITKMRKILDIRKKFINFSMNFKKGTFYKVNANNEKILCFLRKFDKSILITCNLSENENYAEIEIPDVKQISNLIDERQFEIIEKKLKINMSAFEYFIFEIE